MGQETNCEMSALPPAVQQIRKLLGAETPLANPLALTVLPSEQATPNKNVSRTKTPVLDCEGKVKQQVKSRKRTSKKRKVGNLSERNPKKESSSGNVQSPNFHPSPSLPSSMKLKRKVSESFPCEIDGSIEGQNSATRKNSTEGQPRKKRKRKYEENLRNVDENCKNSKKQAGEFISAGEGDEKADNGEEMVLVTELGVVERYKIGYICRSSQDLEAVESSSTTGGNIGIEENMKPVVLGDVCDQEHDNSKGPVTPESACLNKGISGLETMADKKDPSDVTERNSSTQPTIVSQLLNKLDKVERGPQDTMQADHLLKVFNWQVAGAICATVLGASLQGARICRRRDELELSIKRRLEEESRNLDLASAQELQLTPKLIWVMRQQLGEWAEVDEREQAMVEREAVVREQKLDEGVEKETFEAVHQDGSTEKTSDRVSKAGKEANSLKKKRCHGRKMEAKVKEEGELSTEEGELDSSDEEVTRLVQSSCQGKSKRVFTKRVFTLGLS